MNTNTSSLSDSLLSLSKHDSIFITGTDTEIGKTYCSSLLVKHFLKSGISVNPFKPISAGVNEAMTDESGMPVNEDAFELWHASGKQFSINEINPIVYKHPIAPHIAAVIENKPLGFAQLDEVLPAALALADMTLIEGAGGWLLPLNNEQLLSDWVASHNMPVVMVVGVKLGCLNHALLTAQAITASGCELVGWVANFVEGETEISRKNVEFLTQKLKALHNAPCLFEVQKDQTTL